MRGRGPEPKENIIIFYNRRKSDKIIHVVMSKCERVNYWIRHIEKEREIKKKTSLNQRHKKQAPT